jgi:hypothetical protein
MPLFDAADQPWQRLGDLATSLLSLEEIPDDTIEGIRRKQERYEELVRSSGYLYGRLWADAWCAAFLWKKTKEFLYPITEEAFRRIERTPFSVAPWMQEEIQRLAQQYQFFHWHLAFPDVFRLPADGEKPESEQAGWSGGFDVVLGNPPWEKIQSEEQNFFAATSDDIANASGSTRKKLIRNLAIENPLLYQSWVSYKRYNAAVDRFLKASNRYPLTGLGKINTYAVFAEHAAKIIGPQGRVGLIVPLGIVTDDNTKELFWNLMENNQLSNLWGFENESLIFPVVHHSFKFCIISFGQPTKTDTECDFIFYCRQVEDIGDADRRFRLGANGIKLLNPNTKNCPTLRSKRDLGIVEAMYKRFPILSPDGGESSWNSSIHRIINPTDDSELMVPLEPSLNLSFRREIEGNSYMPVYEAKMIHQFDHRFGSYYGQTPAQENQGKLPELSNEEHLNPSHLSQPRFWIREDIIEPWLGRYTKKEWLLAFRDIARSVDSRTTIATIIPKAGPVDPCRCIFLPGHYDTKLTCCFLASINSYPFDFTARQKNSGTHMAIFILRQLLVPPPECFTQTYFGQSPLLEWTSQRVLELVYTAWDLEPFAKDCGYDGPPFRWNEGRRFLLRCELDAAYFHLYGIARDDMDYIMETFPIVKRKDEQKYGEYRTKRLILEIYDAMADAMRTGRPYQTLLNPPPADARCCHSLREPKAV